MNWCKQRGEFVIFFTNPLAVVPFPAALSTTLRSISYALVRNDVKLFASLKPDFSAQVAGP
jgi:hypothetical protein